MKNTNLLLALGALAAFGLVRPAAAQTNEITFDLVPNPQFVHCLKDPFSFETPHAKVTVIRGKLNDYLQVVAEGIKPGLQFDLFTVQNSPFQSNGNPSADFKNFGLAWYQSDLEANRRGRVEASIRTILLDQIFGFDPAVALPPTNSFHVGFWFNNPQDAVACGFDATKPTPFNGEHKAGPLAMISLPQHDGLGPLCTNPDDSKSPAVCNP